MKLDFPKIATRQLDMRKYHPAYKTEITVWVNPPEDFILEYSAIFFDKDNESAKVENKTEKEKEQAAIAWASKLWSQGEPDTHLSVEEITQLVDTARDTDPSIFIWMVSRSLEMIRQHRHAVKKV